MRTLRHAVERGKVHHAYLFVGSRGTGKTSMAKILASCLNCEGGLSRADGSIHPGGPTVEPCGACDSCRSIASATSLDVIEMDAASNNSVDDIRDLRDSVAFAPVSGRHKVYILDEAHMLSQAAWNAFLKTLEEPPPDTVFVLATTEASKVPATVVDRCHRFDFHRPTVEQIASVVRRAAEAESIVVPPEAVAAIARSATGSFRDALGTLEQLVTYSGSTIVLEDVLAVLGVADEQLISEAFDAVRAGDARAALRVVARCAEGGRDATSFTRDLEGRARELLVVQTLGEVPGELSLTQEIDERLSAQAERLGAAEVVRVLDLLGAALEAVRAGADPRTQLELALVKAAAPATDGSTKALLARIERLEQALAGAPPQRAPAPVEVPEVAPAPVETLAQAEAIPEQVTPLNGDLDAIWPAVLETVREQHKLLRAFFSEAAPMSVTEDHITIAFPVSASFNKRKAEEPDNRKILLDALKALTGRRYSVSFELSDDAPVEGARDMQALSEEEIVARLMSELDAEEVSPEELPARGVPSEGTP